MWKNAPAATADGSTEPSTLFVLLIGLGALVALCLLWRLARPGPGAGGPAAERPGAGRWFAGSSRCRWRRDQRRHGQAAMVRWVCADCGVDGYTTDGRPPKLCKRGLRDAGL
jgi:hypothetical protein